MESICHHKNLVFFWLMKKVTFFKDLGEKYIKLIANEKQITPNDLPNKVDLKVAYYPYRNNQHSILRL